MRSQLQMHQTLLTIHLCSYPGVLNDESHLRHVARSAVVKSMYC